MADSMIGEIITDHRERMINLKKYYPFFRLMDVSFEQYKDGKYSALDMGYILMAVLRFFIEENNFREKDVTYKEYLDFFKMLVKRDFGLVLSDEEYVEVADYVFDKIKNDGRPFEFKYYDPVEHKKRVSRMKLVESTIREDMVWYSISADAVEFYLDTKEIKDESRINVSQLEVMETLAQDVCAGVEAYEDFVNTGMKWFNDEEKLFRKNKELIDKAISRLEGSPSGTDSYYRTMKEIHHLEDQLKIAMNKHAQLLRDCTQMQNTTDEAVRRAKLARLRPHMDFATALSDMIRKDNADALKYLIDPLLKLNIRKTLDLKTIDEALMVKPERYEKKEYVNKNELKQIVYEDEAVDERIKHNYTFVMNNLLMCIDKVCLKKSDMLTLDTFSGYMRRAYGDAILKNADYYAFFVNLCQRDEYVVGGDNMHSETFLDGILEESFKGKEVRHILIVRGESDRENVASDSISEEIQVTNIAFKKVF